MKPQKPKPGNSFADRYPDLVPLWHPTKNGDLTPADVTGKAGVEIWWQCDKGHEWKRRVIEISKGRRCPWCFGHKLIPERSMAAHHPDIAAEWHPTKNGDLLPTAVTKASAERVWWQCDEGHEWQTRVYNRTAHGTGCPVCANRKVTDDNSLATLRPDLAAEWHPTKNGDRTPHNVSPGTLLRAWWRCSNGHEWQTFIIGRVNGNGCKVCSNRVAHAGYNLELDNPGLAAQWSPRNLPLKPSDVTPRAGQRVWWVCDEGHEWQALITNRAKGHGCPVCSGFVATPETSLAALRPEAAALWHPTKNGDRTPDQIRPSAAGRAWWRCEKGHEWQTFIASVANGSRCDYCRGRKASPDLNLRTLAPATAEQWHPTKNGDLQPESFVLRSRKIVWWKCSEGDDHEWQAAIYARARGQGCPMCSGRSPSAATSLEAVFPDVAAQWHPIKNGDLTPADVTPGSSKKTWWKCPEGDDHVWQTAISTRVRNWRRRGGGCPYCAETGFRLGEPGWVYVLEGPAWGKFGITNDLDQRLRQHARHGTFGALVGSWEFEDGNHARQIERRLLDLVSEAPTAPKNIPGHSESFPAAMTDMVLDEVHRAVSRLRR